MAATQKRTEFSQAIKAIAQERGLDADVIMDAIKQAYIAAYKRDAKDEGMEVESFLYDVEMDSVSGEAKILAFTEDNPDDKKDVTPPGFGRIAAQTAKQVIFQTVREAEKKIMTDEYTDRVGSLVTGTVLRFDGSHVRVDLGKTEALMPSNERALSERLNSGQRISFLLKEIIDTPHGKQIILSRKDDNFVKKVFEREVPEIASGSVKIVKIAREPGVRTKIAVFTDQPGVDPVGSCVGQKGSRVQTVTNELGGERVDIIPWTENAVELIKATLKPVEVENIELNEKTKEAIVFVPEDALSLAIGKDGQNARLTSELTDWNIEIKPGEIKSKPEVVEPEIEEKSEVVQEEAGEVQPVEEEVQE